MNKNIILIGFMGTGKTAVGKRLANRLHMEYFDTDDNIEQVSGMTVSKIFNEYGEIRFRSEEVLAVKRACLQNNRVIATGGGAVLNPDNLSLFKENGILIALEASPEEIQKRVSKRSGIRPLLGQDKSLEKIISLLEQRIPIYKQADYTINTNGKEIDQVVEEIVALLNSMERL